MELIDKSALVAEIERFRSLTKEQACGCLTSDYKGGINKMAELILSFIDTLEVKEDAEHYELEEFTKIIRGNLTGISKDVQSLFEAKYQQLTGNKMYGGYKD